MYLWEFKKKKAKLQNQCYTLSFIYYLDKESYINLHDAFHQKINISLLFSVYSDEFWSEEFYKRQVMWKRLIAVSFHLFFFSLGIMLLKRNRSRFWKEIVKTQILSESHDKIYQTSYFTITYMLQLKYHIVFNC